MYESYSQQSLPSARYRELIGTAICVFNSNNGFIIENILCHDAAGEYSWYQLTDLTSGQLKEPIQNTISRLAGSTIADMFSELVILRNRIVHSFRITAPEGISSDGDRQMLATKHYRSGEQEIVTEQYLMDFIEKNNVLSAKLHAFRES